MIQLGIIDLALAAGLVLALAFVTRLRRLGIAKDLVVAASRMTIQLLLVGLVLRALFAHAAPFWIGVMTLVMLVMAGYEIRARQRRRLRGGWGYGVGVGSVFISSFGVTAIALLFVVQPLPWYAPQYLVPILGMILGKTMSGVALALDRVTQGAWQGRELIEQRLMLGQDRREATSDLRRDAVRTAMIPIINAMAIAGVVSLPGSMTGQILAGSPPFEAVKYQVLIMLFAAASSGTGVLMAVWLGVRRLFDERSRLRLDHLAGDREL